LQLISPAGTPESQLHARAHRAKLQNALLKEVDTKHISLSKRLIKVTRQASGRQLIEFQDGFKDEVDLVVGADGVRSVSQGLYALNWMFGNL
jgi:salicylate hydroxylase